MHLVGSRVFSIALMNGLRIDEQCTVIVIAMHRILTGDFGESTPVVNHISGTFFIVLYNYIRLPLLTAFPIPPARIAFFIHIGKERVTGSYFPLADQIFITQHFALISFTDTAPVLAAPLHFIIKKYFTYFRKQRIILIHQRFGIVEHLNAITFIFHFLEFALVKSTPTSVQLIINLPRQRSILGFGQVLKMRLFTAKGSLGILILVVTVGHIVHNVTYLHTLYLTVWRVERTIFIHTNQLVAKYLAALINQTREVGT